MSRLKRDEVVVMESPCSASAVLCVWFLLLYHDLVQDNSILQFLEPLQSRSRANGIPRANADGLARYQD